MEVLCIYSASGLAFFSLLLSTPLPVMGHGVSYQSLNEENYQMRVEGCSNLGVYVIKSWFNTVFT